MTLVPTIIAGFSLMIPFLISGSAVLSAYSHEDLLGAIMWSAMTLMIGGLGVVFFFGDRKIW